MSNKMFYIEVGIQEPTVIYEVELKRLAGIEGATAKDIVTTLERMGVRRLIVGNEYPNMIDKLRTKFLVKKVLRLHTKRWLEDV